MSPLYILNPTTSNLALAINEEAVGSIRPCGAGYAPSSTWLRISRREEEKKPHIGENTLGVVFEQEPRASCTFRLYIPPGFQPEEEDAVAVATRGYLALARSNGQPLAEPSRPSCEELPPRSTTGGSMTESDNQAAALGNVYVFNYWSEELEKLNVAGETVSPKPIEPWSKGTGSEGTKYTPKGIAVPRAKAREETPGKFGVGPQPVRAEWASQVRKVTVNIPDSTESEVNLTEDMILLLSPYVAILLSPNGHLLGQPAQLTAV